MIHLCEMRSSAPASPLMREITIATVFGGRAGGDLSRVEGDPDFDVDEKDGDGRFDEPHGVRQVAMYFLSQAGALLHLYLAILMMTVSSMYRDGCPDVPFWACRHLTVSALFFEKRSVFWRASGWALRPPKSKTNYRLVEEWREPQGLSQQKLLVSRPMGFQMSQNLIHSELIFRLLLKITVNQVYQCGFIIFQTPVRRGLHLIKRNTNIQPLPDFLLSQNSA